MTVFVLMRAYHHEFIGVFRTREEALAVVVASAAPLRPEDIPDEDGFIIEEYALDD